MRFPATARFLTASSTGGYELMTYRVNDLHAREILDSRGCPTLEVALTLGDGVIGVAGVPSGASTGSREAVELRDGDRDRYAGAGVSARRDEGGGGDPRRVGRPELRPLAAIHDALVRLDGNADKSRLGANSTTGVSTAAARAMANSDNTPLYRWLAPDGVSRNLPFPNFNVINGGATPERPRTPGVHDRAAGRPLVSAGPPRRQRDLRGAARRLHDTRMGTGLGDEGGFAPELAT